MGMGQLKSYWEKQRVEKKRQFQKHLSLTLKFPWVDLKSFVEVFMNLFYK